jgi:hypothetical protein
MGFIAMPRAAGVRWAVAALLWLPVGGILFARQAEPAAQLHRPGRNPDRVILTWAADPSTSMSVTWRTDTTVTAAFAEIAESDDGPEFAKKAARTPAVTQRYETGLGPAHSHSVTFRDLRPSAEYLYRVGAGEHWSEWNPFRTASDKAEPLTFLYMGDAQNNIFPMWSRVIRKAYSSAPEARFIVHAGDLINRHDRDEEWGEWHQAAGWINRQTPSLPSPGNHEYGRGPGGGRQITANWRPQFTLPENGPAGLEETCYSLDIQGLRMISLNSSEKQKEQARWLDELLSNNPNRWTAIVFHHPIQSAARGRDNKELRELWQPVFDKHRVDLVLQGHDHVYGRTAPTAGPGVHAGAGGTVYVVSVSGPKMYGLTPGTLFERTAEDTQLFQVIRIAGDSLAYEARTARGLLYDAFELRKRAGGPNEFVNRTPQTPPRLRKPE